MTDWTNEVVEGLKYHILVRGGKDQEKEYQITSCCEDCDPLYGNGSWSILKGGYDSWGAAWDALNETE